MFRKDIINSGRKFSLAITGGGTDVIPMLLRNGGMSKVFMGAEIPYSEEALNNITDYKHFGDKAVSKCVADTLASFVWDKYSADFGVGVTASLYSDGQREGRINQAYLSIVTTEEDYENHLVFTDGSLRNRLSQETYLAHFILANIQFFSSKKIDRNLLDFMFFCDTKLLDNSFYKEAVLTASA